MLPACCYMCNNANFPAKIKPPFGHPSVVSMWTLRKLLEQAKELLRQFVGVVA